MHKDAIRIEPVPSKLTSNILTFFLWALLMTGCARFQPLPLSPAHNAAELDSRSLTNNALKSFLEKNLQRDLSQWPPVEWDFEMLALAAFYYHPSLEVARAQWAVAKGGEMTASQRPNPTVSVAPAYNTTTAMVSPWLVVSSLDVPIETAGKRRYRRAHAARLSEAARLNIVSVAWQVRSTLRSNLLDLTAAEHRDTMLRNQVAFQEKIVQRQQQLVEAGAIAGSEFLPFRITLQKARLDLADAQRLRADARGRVAEAIGIPLRALDQAKLAFDLRREPISTSELTTDGVRRTALQGRADILEALAEYAAAQAALQLEIAKQYPDFHLQPGYEFDQGDSKWSLGISLELPVFSRNQGPIAEAKAKRVEAAARFNALQAKVLAEIDRSVESFRITETNAATLRSLADAQAKRRDAVAAQLKAGAADQVDLLNAEFESATYELVALDNQIKLQQALGALEDAIQRPLALPEAIFRSQRSDAR